MAIEICDDSRKLPIHQLNKLDVKDVTRDDIYPLSVIQAIFDARTGIRLDSILSAMNFLYLPYGGSSEATRLQIPLQGRHRSLILSYIDYDKYVHIEQYVSDNFTDEDWQRDENWKTPYTEGKFLVNVEDAKLLEILNNIFNEYKHTSEFTNLVTSTIRDWLVSSEGLEIIKEGITRELDSRNVVYWGEVKKNDNEEEDKYKHNFIGHIRLTEPSSIQYIESIEILRSNIDIPKNILYPSDFNENGELDFTAYANNNKIKLYYYLKDGNYYLNTKVFYPTYDDQWWDVRGGISPIISNITEEGPYLIDITIKPINTVNLSMIRINGELNDSFFANLDHIEIQNHHTDNPLIIITPDDFIFDNNPNDEEDSDPYVETSIDITDDIIITVVPKQADANVSNINVYYNGDKINHKRTANTFTIPYKGNDDYYLVYFNGINVPTPPEPVTKQVNVWQAVEGEDLTISVNKVEVSVDNNTFVQYDKFTYDYNLAYNLTMRSQHDVAYEFVGWYKNNEVITNATNISNLSLISTETVITRESISDEPVITNYISILRRIPIDMHINIRKVDATDLNSSIGNIYIKIGNEWIESNGHTINDSSTGDISVTAKIIEQEGYKFKGWFTYPNVFVPGNITVDELVLTSLNKEYTYIMPYGTNEMSLMAVMEKNPEPEPVKHLVYPYFNFNSMEDVNKLDDLIIISDDPSVPEIKADLASIEYSRWNTAISNINEYFTVKFVPKYIGPSRSLTTEVKEYYVTGAEADKHQKIIRLEQNLYKVEYCGYPNKEYRITMKPFETARDINFVLKVTGGVYGYVRIEYSGITYLDGGHEFNTMLEKEFSYSFKSVGKSINIVTGPVFDNTLKVNSLKLNGKEIDYTLNNSNTEIKFNIDLDAETYDYELILS